MSISGSESGGLWKQSNPWLVTIWPDSACNLACSLPRFPLAMLDQGGGQPAPSTEKVMSYHLPRAQVPASTLVLGRVTGAEQNRFQKNKQPGTVAHTCNPSSREREACKELEAGLGYRVRLYLKKPKPNKQKPTFISLESKSNMVLFCFVFLLSLAHNPRRGH